MVRSSYFADRQYFGEPAPKPFSREDVCLSAIRITKLIQLANGQTH